MKKILPIANGLALMLTIVVNYCCNAGFLNGKTMKTVSDKYYNYFTPAGFAFSIWGLIYLGLLGFVVYTAINASRDKFKDTILAKIGWWFVLSCLANSFWVVAWLTDYTGTSVLVMLILLFSLIKIVVNTRMELDAHPFKHYLFVFWPFALYLGWVSVALIANFSAYLTKIGWGGFGVSNSNWAIVMICVAGLVNILMVYTRNLREFAVVGIWALFAISVSNSRVSGDQSIVYACYGVMLIIGLVIVQNGLKSRSRTAESM